MFLFFVKIRDVIKFMQVFYIAEYFLHVSHVLVNVVKVGNQQLPPSEKVVKRLVNAGAFGKTLVDVTNKFYRITYSKSRMPTEKVTDCDIRRRPNRPPGNLCQIFIEKQGRAFVGENNGYTGHVSTMLVENIFSYKFQELFH